jgi:hypothetical protein
MIIRRIQANEPTEEHAEGEKNKKRIEDSTQCDSEIQRAQIKVVRHADHNGHENTSNQLRRIFPRSPRL